MHILEEELSLERRADGTKGGNSLLYYGKKREQP